MHVHNFCADRQDFEALINEIGAIFQQLQASANARIAYPKPANNIYNSRIISNFIVFKIFGIKMICCRRDRRMYHLPFEFDRERRHVEGNKTPHIEQECFDCPIFGSGRSRRRRAHKLNLLVPGIPKEDIPVWNQAMLRAGTLD